jgi:hypothetical protein
MMKKLGLAGFTLLLLSSSIAGCTEVEKCAKDELGCIDQPPAEGDTCLAGLVLQGGKCVKGTGGGADGGTEGDYCENAGVVPQTVPVPPSCEPGQDQDPFMPAEICRRACVQKCMRAEVMCSDFSCDQDCNGAAVRAECLVECPGMDAECLTTACLKIQNARCEAFDCPMGHARKCDGVQCTDTCTGNTKDTFCDDGDPASAAYSFCAYGTDCSDCGPRVGSRPPRAPLGGLCPGGRDVGCEGYNDDYLRNNVFCVHVEGTQDGQFACVPDCTSPEEECPEGFDCQELVYTSGAPYEDTQGTQGAACFPMFCGS